MPDNSKTDQGPMWPLPAGRAKTLTPNGSDVVDSYGKKPIEDRYNPDPGDEHPRDPARSRR